MKSFHETQQCDKKIKGISDALALWKSLANGHASGLIGLITF